MMRLQELVAQPRFPDPWLAYHGDDLAAARARLLRCVAQLIHFRITADKAAESARSGHLQPRARLARASELVNVDRLRNALDRNRTDGFHRDVSLGKRQR